MTDFWLKAALNCVFLRDTTTEDSFVAVPVMHERGQKDIEFRFDIGGCDSLPAAEDDLDLSIVTQGWTLPADEEYSISFSETEGALTGSVTLAREL